MDSVFLRALIGHSIGEYPALFTDSPPKSRKLRAKYLPGFLPETNKEISQLIKQAVPEIYEEGDEVRFGRFNR